MVSRKILGGEKDGFSRYLIDCECTDIDHQIECYIETDKETNFVDVEFLVTTNAKFEENIFKRFLFSIKYIFTGEIKRSSSIIMDYDVAKEFCNIILEEIKK